MSLQGAAHLLAHHWLGARGVVFVEGRRTKKGPFILVGTSDGRRPLGLPRVFKGFRVLVFKQKAIMAERALDNPQDPETTVRQVLQAVVLVTAPVAAAVSYHRNHSLGWAILSSFVSIPYLTYVAISGPKEST